MSKKNPKSTFFRSQFKFYNLWFDLRNRVAKAKANWTINFSEKPQITEYSGYSWAQTCLSLCNKEFTTTSAFLLIYVTVVGNHSPASMEQISSAQPKGNKYIYSFSIKTCQKDKFFLNASGTLLKYAKFMRAGNCHSNTLGIWRNLFILG